jgi:signal transduction histidine kinase
MPLALGSHVRHRKEGSVSIRSLQTRAAAVFAGVIALLTLCVAIISATVTKQNVYRTERDAISGHALRLRAAIEDSLGLLESHLPREVVTAGNPAHELPPQLSNESPQSGITFRRLPPPDATILPSTVPSDTSRLSERLLALLTSKSEAEPHLLTIRGVLHHEGQCLLIVAARSDSRAPWMIATRPIDETYLGELGSRLALPVSLTVQPDFKLLAAPTADQPQTGVHVLSPQRIAGYASYLDLGGRGPIVLLAESTREIYRTGIRNIYQLVFSVAMAGIIVGLAGWQIIDRWVVARIRSLQLQVSKIARGTDLDLRISIDGPDELSELADSVNQLLEALSRRTDELGEEIRERVKAQERLSQANRELQSTLQFRQDLSNMLVHDIRSPLTVIDFYLQIQARRMGAAAANDQSLNLAMKSVNRLNLMINDLLVMAKFESGKLTLNCTTFDLRTVIAKNIDEMRFLAQKRNVTIREELGPDQILVHLDSNLLWRVVENLLTNAVKYSPDHSSITVRTGVRGAIPGAASPADKDHALLSVIDSGPGIPAELHDSIFEKFNVGKLDRSKLQIGLGLSFCRMIVEAQGGRIWVENNTPSGSIFHIQFPIHVPVRTGAVLTES